MIINISDVWEDASIQHYDFLSSKIDDGIKILGSTIIDMYVRSFLEENREIIIKGKPTDLILCIESFKNYFGSKELSRCALQKIDNIFDFSSFSKKSNKEWTAYDLCSLAKYKVCCYCHMNNTGTSLPNDEEKGYRPPIDHFYAKSEYSFLSLTLSNFIPCCEKCNGSQMKHSIDFALVPHLNPLIDEESIEFELHPITFGENLAEALALQLSAENYTLRVEAKRNLDLSNMSIKTFQLKSRYNNYSKQAYHLARRAKNFMARKDMLDNELMFRTELEDLLEFDPYLYKNTEYGKLRLCIAKQFGAIDEI